MVKKIDGFTERGIMLREKFSVTMMIKLGISFVLSLILYYATGNEVLSALFGFLMIITGTLILLFLLIYLIFFFVKRMDNNTNISNSKIVAKKKVAKKTIKKKPVKKVTKKRATKKVVKKKAVRKAKK